MCGDCVENNKRKKNGPKNKLFGLKRSVVIRKE
jgi:hypothetical protein